MRQKFGIDEELEDAADELIRRSLEGVTSHEAKKDILTPAKARVRRQRGIQTGGTRRVEENVNSELLGQPDKAMRLGMFGRVTNLSRPDLNSRDGLAPPHRTACVVAWDAGLTPTPKWCTITREAWLRGDDYEAHTRLNRVRG